MKNYIEHRYILIFFILAILSVPFMSRGLFESSEGRYARVAQTMVETHDYWMPKLNGHPHLTKPPLTYWIIAAGIDIAGSNTFGARFFHTLAWIITGAIIVRIGSEIASPFVGLISGLVFSTSLFPSLGSWSLTTDPLLVFFEAFYLLALVRFEKEKTKASAYVFWIMLGFALLTKGPIALLPLPFLIFRWRDTLWELLKTKLWIISIFLSLSWYILLEIQNPGILYKLTRDELILRATTDLSGRNPFWWAPFAVYGIPMVIGWGLWPILISKKKVSEIAHSKSKTWQFSMFVWIVASLIFFSLVQSRLTLYILPLTIPASLLIADLIQESKHLAKITLINFALIFSLKIYGTYFYTSPDNSLQIVSFTQAKIKNEPLHLLWEKSLYGVEFYLPNQFEKNIDPFSTFTPGPESTWVLYQKKREEIFERLKNEKKFQIKGIYTFYKWRLCEVSMNRKH